MIFGSYDKNVKIVLSEMDVTYDQNAFMNISYLWK